MKIPQVRAALLLMAEELEAQAHELMQRAQAIRSLVPELCRRRAIRKAPAQSKRITPAIKAQILALRQHYPDATQQAIGEMVGVNSGRVSETERGKRT